MKWVLFFGFISLLFNLKAQDSTVFYSFYFSEKAPQILPQSTAFTTDLFGKYELKKTDKNGLRTSAGDDLKVDESGVYILKNQIITISREEVRENPKYDLRHGYIFGVSETDSFAVATQGDNYLFLMPTKAYLYQKGETTQFLIPFSANRYFIFTKESNGYFSVIQLLWENHQLLISDLDLPYSVAEKLEHDTTVESGIKTLILSPKKSDWKWLNTYFVMYDTYLKG